MSWLEHPAMTSPSTSASRGRRPSDPSTLRTSRPSLAYDQQVVTSDAGDVTHLEDAVLVGPGRHVPVGHGVVEHRVTGPCPVQPTRELGGRHALAVEQAGDEPLGTRVERDQPQAIDGDEGGPGGGGDMILDRLAQQVGPNGSGLCRRQRLAQKVAQVALGVGEVALGSREHHDHLHRFRTRQTERHLVFGAEGLDDLPVVREPVELLPGHHVGDAQCGSVAARGVTGRNRVLGVACDTVLGAPRGWGEPRRVPDHHHSWDTRVDLVVPGVVHGDHFGQLREENMRELGELGEHHALENPGEGSGVVHGGMLPVPQRSHRGPTWFPPYMPSATTHFRTTARSPATWTTLTRWMSDGSAAGRGARPWSRSARVPPMRLPRSPQRAGGPGWSWRTGW